MGVHLLLLIIFAHISRRILDRNLFSVAILSMCVIFVMLRSLTKGNACERYDSLINKIDSDNVTPTLLCEY